MFPVQSYSCNNLTACFEKCFTAVPCSEANFWAKCEINSGISSLLSFKEGTLIRITAKRWYKSSRKRPSAISFFKSLFVAAMTRTSTLMSLSAPTRVITFSCKARNTLAWAERLMSPISSKKIVPLSATSNLPARSFTAEVKAPFTWPNNSLSINSLGMAAQFTSIKEKFALWLFSCNWWATSSFPVPLGPVINTLASVWATLSIINLMRLIASLSPIIS